MISLFRNAGKGSKQKDAVSIQRPDLHVPEQHSPARASFDIRPEMVRKWIGGLPMANLGETARLVFKAMVEINRLQFPVKDRERIQALLRSPTEYVCGALKKYYIGKHFPLPERNRKIAELTRELYSELAIGYKIILLEHCSAAQTGGDRKLLAETIGCTMHYLGRVLLSSYQIYGPYPEHIWAEIYALYRFAEAGELDDMEIDINDGTTCIRDIFLHIVLLSLASPYRLRQSDIDKVHQALESWASWATIGPFSEEAGKCGLFVVDLATDDAPTYLDLHKNTKDNCRVIDTSGLARSFSSPQAINDEAGRLGLSPHLLQQLSITWEVLPQRGFPRSEQSSQVEAAIGLSAAHYFISGEVGFSPEKLEKGAEESANPSFKSTAQYTSNPVLSESDIAEDVWDRMYTVGKELRIDANPFPPTLNPEYQDSSITYGSHIFKVLNISASGYALQCTSDCPVNLQVGELIAIRDVEKNDVCHWGLGVIRRMKHDGDKLEMGIQLLTPNAVAVATYPLHEGTQQGDYLRSLILPELRSINQPATLITPALPYKPGSEVCININGNETRVRLTRALQGTASFSQFLFTPLESAEEHREQESELPDKDFDSLWTSI